MGRTSPARTRQLRLFLFVASKALTHTRVYTKIQTHTPMQYTSTRNLTNRRAAIGSGSCFSKAALDKHAQNNRISKPGEEHGIRCLSLFLLVFVEFVRVLILNSQPQSEGASFAPSFTDRPLFRFAFFVTWVSNPFLFFLGKMMALSDYCCCCCLLLS